MKHSEQLNELAAALSKAQSTMEAAAKDKLNPHFKSKYADLGSVWDAIREPLTRNGLSVVQLPSMDGDRVCVDTILLHSSGQFIEASYALPATKNDAQGFGSAITYMKRYALTGVGVAPEDDDGNAASARATHQHATAPPAPSQRQAEPRGETAAPADNAVVQFLKGKSLTLSIPGLKAGKPNYSGWAYSFEKAVLSCDDLRTLERLWADNEDQLSALNKHDTQLRVSVEQSADARREALSPPLATLAAE